MQPDEWQLRDVAEAECASLRERVVGLQHNDELVVPKRCHGQAVHRRHRTHDPEVGQIVGNSGGDARADMFLKMNMDVRVLREKRRKCRRQKLYDRRDVGKHSDMSAGARCVPPNLLIELLCLVQNAACSRQKSMSRRRELHAFGTAHEQWGAKGFLQVGESLAYRGSDGVTAFSRPRDAAGLRDRDKLLEIAEVKVQGAGSGPGPRRTP